MNKQIRTPTLNMQIWMQLQNNFSLIVRRRNYWGIYNDSTAVFEWHPRENLGSECIKLIFFFSQMTLFEAVKNSPLWPLIISCPQVLGRLFAPSQKLKKWTQQFCQCFELVLGILNAPRKFFLAVYEPILKLQGLEGVGFQGKNCLTKMVSNFSKIDCGFR